MKENNSCNNNSKSIKTNHTWEKYMQVEKPPI